MSECVKPGNPAAIADETIPPNAHPDYMPVDNSLWELEEAPDEHGTYHDQSEVSTDKTDLSSDTEEVDLSDVKYAELDNKPGVPFSGEDGTEGWTPIIWKKKRPG